MSGFLALCLAGLLAALVTLAVLDLRHCRRGLAHPQQSPGGDKVVGHLRVILCLAVGFLIPTAAMDIATVLYADKGKALRTGTVSALHGCQRDPLLSWLGHRCEVRVVWPGPGPERLTVQSPAPLATGDHIGAYLQRFSRRPGAVTRYFPASIRAPAFDLAGWRPALGAGGLLLGLISGIWWERTWRRHRLPGGSESPPPATQDRPH
ncbi:hypothetical protein ACLD02_03950 [Alloalcanivorax sp. C16-2]|uniref:hypothetical protein n=1 Tax=Alloalcanivorax TaxID=3020832 RepID=UPI0019334FA9|nr:hypothetical protein [Alloalcanivorax marinus]MBL7250567.1 hypothetical protein [Alloalcanivorax marinus]